MNERTAIFFGFVLSLAAFTLSVVAILLAAAR